MLINKNIRHQNDQKRPSVSSIATRNTENGKDSKMARKQEEIEYCKSFQFDIKTASLQSTIYEESEADEIVYYPKSTKSKICLITPQSFAVLKINGGYSYQSDGEELFSYKQGRFYDICYGFGHIFVFEQRKGIWVKSLLDLEAEPVLSITGDWVRSSTAPFGAILKSELDGRVILVNLGNEVIMLEIEFIGGNRAHNQTKEQDRKLKNVCRVARKWKIVPKGDMTKIDNFEVFGDTDYARIHIITLNSTTMMLSRTTYDYMLKKVVKRLNSEKLINRRQNKRLSNRAPVMTICPRHTYLAVAAQMEDSTHTIFYIKNGPVMGFEVIQRFEVKKQLRNPRFSDLAFYGYYEEFLFLVCLVFQQSGRQKNILLTFVLDSENNEVFEGPEARRWHQMKANQLLERFEDSLYSVSAVEPVKALKIDFTVNDE